MFCFQMFSLSRCFQQFSWLCLSLKWWLLFFVVGVLASHLRVWTLWIWAEYYVTSDQHNKNKASMPSGSVYFSSEINCSSLESIGVGCHSSKFHHPKIGIGLKTKPWWLNFLWCCVKCVFSFETKSIFRPRQRKTASHHISGIRMKALMHGGGAVATYLLCVAVVTQPSQLWWERVRIRQEPGRAVPLMPSPLVWTKVVLFKAPFAAMIHFTEVQSRTHMSFIFSSLDCNTNRGEGKGCSTEVMDSWGTVVLTRWRPWDSATLSEDSRKWSLQTSG